jgi:hypothetical protein
MLCIPVPSDDVERQWERMLRFLGPAIETSNGRWTPEDVFNELAAGRLLGWVLIEGPLLYGAGIGEIHQYPGCRVFCCLWLGGVQSELWMDLLDSTVSAWAAEHGCTRMEIIGRKGWERMGARFGFKPSYVFFEKELVPCGSGKDVGAAEVNDFNAAPVVG